MRALTLLLALLLPLPISVAAAAETFQGSMALGTRAVPLPPGAWTVIGTRDENSMNNAGTVRYRSVLLAQEKDGRLLGLVHARTNLTPGLNLRYSNAGLSTPCRDQQADLAPARVEVSEQGYDCRRVASWLPAGMVRATASDEWHGFLDRRDALANWAPSRGQVVLFGLGDAKGQLQVQYLFNPEAHGLLRDTRGWAQNGWNPANHTPGHTAYLARLAAWANAADPVVARGFSRASTTPAPAF